MVMKIQMTLTIDLGDNFINEEDKEERDWLINEILRDEKKLSLWSDEIGDRLGKVIKVKGLRVKEVKEI